MDFSIYGNFSTATGHHYVHGPQARTNAVARLNYDALGFILRGKKMSRVLRGGDTLKGEVYLKQKGAGEWIGLETETTPEIHTTGTFYSVPWSMHRVVDAWDERAMRQNMNGNAGADGGFQQFSDMVYARKQNLEMQKINLIDDALWAVPDKSKMETSGSARKEPLSIPALVNEFSNGLYPAEAPGGVWTTIQQIATTEEGFSNFVPYRGTYDNRTVNSPTNMIAALDLAYEKLNFKPPPANGQYFEKESGMLPAQKWMAASPEGVVALKQLCRASQDRWGNESDAYGRRPTYAGVPIVTVPQLTSKALYPTGTAGALSTELVTTNSVGGWRYYIIDSESIDWVWSSDWYDHMDGPISQQNNPSRKAIFYETQCGSFCNNRRLNGMIYPSANIA